jgi:hypothetical protein
VTRESWCPRAGTTQVDPIVEQRAPRSRVDARARGRAANVRRPVIGARLAPASVKGSGDAPTAHPCISSTRLSRERRPMGQARPVCVGWRRQRRASGCPRRTATRSHRASTAPRRQQRARRLDAGGGRLLLAAAAALESLDDGAAWAALFGAFLEEATGDRVAYPTAFARASLPGHGLKVVEPSCSFNFPARPAVSSPSVSVRADA